MRRLVTCLGLGLALLYSRTADALPRLEVSTTLGGADASEYLVRVANPDAEDSSGVIELRTGPSSDERTVARAPFSVPANSTRYVRVPADKGQRFSAVAVTGGKTVRAQQRYGNEGTVVIFDIPPRDEQRLRELRTHTGPSAVITHATYDENTHTPVLTRRAAVYDGVALVLVPSSTFLALPAPERDALTTWVRAGGSIAFSITDERDRSRLPGPGDLGLGHVNVLAYDAWSTEANGDVAIQEKIVALAERNRVTNRFVTGPWSDAPVASLDPNEGYRSVLALAGVLLAAQALITALAFRRLATRRGMGSAYRFVAGSSTLAFAAVVGLGVYAKGGFGARARELTLADAASGESVAWVQRSRTYFASDTRTIDVTPHDASNVLDLPGHDSHAVLRVDDANANSNIVLGDVGVRPWQTTAVTERGTTTLGAGVRVESEGGKIVVRNASGATLRNVIVATPQGTCLAFGDIANGETQTSESLQSCIDFGPDWAPYHSERYVRTPARLTLFGRLDEAPTSIDGFRLEKRTTLLRVTGGAS